MNGTVSVGAQVPSEMASQVSALAQSLGVTRATVLRFALGHVTREFASDGRARKDGVYPSGTYLEAYGRQHIGLEEPLFDLTIEGE